MKILRSVLVPFPIANMFDVIEQAEFYPQFLPWCVGATILERSDDSVSGKIDFSYRQVRFSFRTCNAKRRPDWLRVRMVDGPFRHFDGDWRLTPLGEHGCKVEFDVSYEISDGLLDQIARPAVDLVSRSMIDAFVKRAEDLVGKAR